MSHTFIKSHFHVVFSTKERRKIISEETQPHLFSYIAGICRNQKMISVAIGGVEDYVHMLFPFTTYVGFGQGNQSGEGKLLEMDE